jgi:hypothetical protein
VRQRRAQPVPPMSAFGTGHAVIIGVGGNLPGTINDAKRIRSILTDPSRCAYPTSQVTTLLGSEATRSRIVTALEGLADVDDEATVVVYFSGHGARIEQGGASEHYVVPHAFSWDAIQETAITGTELRQLLAGVPAARVLLLLDCCLAGGLHPPPGPLRSLSRPYPSQASRACDMVRGSS